MEAAFPTKGEHRVSADSETEASGKGNDLRNVIDTLLTGRHDPRY